MLPPLPILSETPEQLLRRYEAVIRSFETETCPHGAGSLWRTGEAWRACCGISYEALNDLFVRDLLERAQPLPAALAEQLAHLDARLRALYDAPSSGEGAWWREQLPRNVAP